MGMVIRAVIGFAIASAVLDPGAFMHHFDTARLAVLKAELGTQHPAERLKTLLKEPLPRLRGEDSAGLD